MTKIIVLALVIFSLAALGYHAYYLFKEVIKTIDEEE